MVLWCGLNMASGCVGSRAFWKRFRYRPRSSFACVLPGATWHELQSYLLDLEVLKREQATNQGWLLLVPGNT